MISITDKYIDNLYELMQLEFPEHVILQAKKCLLDYIGVTLAGAKMLKEKGNIFLDYSKNQEGNISVIGFNRKNNLYDAALINGMSAHIAELDDGVRQGSIHPGAPIISALLPVVQQYQLNGDDLLRGIIVGYEAAIRLANAIQPSHRNKGYHATSTCGTIGAALGIGAALRFSKQQIKDALSTAATSASGMLNVTKGASELKPFNAGQAAVSGIVAAITARAGFNGPTDVLAGEWGFISMITEKGDLSMLEKTPEEKFGVEKVYMKPYAACRHCHPAIEAALEIRQKYGIMPEQIAEVQVSTYRLATDGHNHTEISGITDSKMSIPYSVAVALATGKAGIEEFSNKSINNRQILNLTKKIKVLTDNSLNVLVPEKRPAIVTVSSFDRKISVRVDLAKGEPENPMTIDEINEKFTSLLMFSGKNHNDIIYLSHCVWDIEKNIAELIKYIN